MNPRGSPQGIGPTHVSDEFAYRGIEGGTPQSLRTAFPVPIPPEALTVPPDNRLGLHNVEGRGPRPPKQSISTGQLWPFCRTVQDRELLPKGKIFEDELLARLEE